MSIMRIILFEGVWTNMLIILIRVLVIGRVRVPGSSIVSGYSITSILVGLRFDQRWFDDGLRNGEECQFEFVITWRD